MNTKQYNAHLGTHLHASVDVVLDEATEGLSVRGDKVLLVGKRQQVRLGFRELVLYEKKK